MPTALGKETMAKIAKTRFCPLCNHELKKIAGAGQYYFSCQNGDCQLRAYIMHKGAFDAIKKSIVGAGKLRKLKMEIANG
jgi:hypothetical protein